MPIEANVISTYKLTGYSVDGRARTEAKTGEEFQKDIQAVYNKAAEGSGRILTSDMVQLRVGYPNKDGSEGSSLIELKDHAVIAVDYPEPQVALER